MSFRNVVSPVRLLALLAITMLTTALGAQEPPSRVDIFTGYSFRHMNDSDVAQIVGAQTNLRRGFTVNTTYFLSRRWGLSFDGGWNACQCEPKVWSFEGGPTFRFPHERVTPYLHAVAGLNRMKMGSFGWDNGLGVLAGGGVDVKVLQHVSLRVIQAEYEYSRHQFGTFETQNFQGYRLSAGLVWRFGSIGPPPVPPSAACSVQPSEVMAGEPVSVTATGNGFNPKRTMRYAWSGTGVTVKGENSTTQIDTTGLQPGSYRVAANVSDGSRNGVANCNASFSVRAPVGPNITCSPNPGTVQPGGSSTIQSSANSPDRRPLTYSYSTSAGTISGAGSSATLNTAGVEPGSITVRCNVADDRSPALTATANTMVMVEAPPPPAPPAPPALEASQLNQIDFKVNSPRVDNAAKAILDDVALRMQREPDARVVLVGESEAGERGGQKLAAKRAANTKAYLVNEKGIDPSRIDTRTGSAGTRQTQIWLVPSGTVFNEQGTTPSQ